MKIIEACSNVLGEDVVGALVAANRYEPVIAQLAATTLFMRGGDSCSTETAGAIRQYLNELELFGSSTLH